MDLTSEIIIAVFMLCAFCFGILSLSVVSVLICEYFKEKSEHRKRFELYVDAVLKEVKIHRPQQ